MPMDVRINGEGNRIAQRLPKEALEHDGRWLVAWIDPEDLDLSLTLLTDEEVSDWIPLVPELTPTSATTALTETAADVADDAADDVAQRPG